MSYQYKSVSFTNINKDGTALSSALTFTPSTTPSSVERFAIGNRVRMALVIERTMGSSWTNKLVRVNLGMFLNTNFQGLDFGFTSNTFVSGTAQVGVIDAGNDGNQLTRENIDAISFQLTSSTELTVTIDFYITTDVNDYMDPSYFVNNQVRFLLARRDFFNAILRNTLKTVFSDTSRLGITTRVFDWGGFLENVLHPTDSAPFWMIPIANRWYNSDFLGGTLGQRYISNLQITSPSQVAASLPNLTDATATSSQVGSLAADSIFTVTGNQLSPSEKNTVTLTLNGFSDSGLSVTTINNIRVLVIRTDNFTNAQRFTDAYKQSEAIIPSLDAATAQLDGSIYSPTSWTQNGGTGEIVLTFDIDGNELDNRREYRIIVNVYEDANPERPTSHISPALKVLYVPPAIPTIDGFLATYANEYTTNDLSDIGPHQRIRARIEIDKASFVAALNALGLTGSFDNSLVEVTATLLEIPSVIAQTQETYKPNTLTLPADNSILTTNMVIVTDDAATLSLGAIFRIEEERVNTTGTIRWNVRIAQPTYDPQTFVQYNIEYDQTLGIRFFENDNGAPYLTGIRILDPVGYPTTKTDLLDICDYDQVLVEVEKDNALLSGSVSFIATIYTSDEFGDTTNAAIEEEESFAPANIIMPQLNVGKLDAVEPNFGGDDFVTFLVNAQQLIQGQRYFVTGIALDQVPDYCPIGLAQFTTISTEQNGISGWFVKGNADLVVAEIIANPDYVSGPTIVYHRVVDSVGNPVGVTMLSGNTLTTQFIPISLTDVYYEIRIDAVFDPGTGPHNVSHTLRVNITQPVFGGGSVNYNSNSYTCSDLG